ncbi:M61 family metallopeptidase [Paucibacter sp. Y2R2-4]|uniref:M61 family metallopeptidase n=1 Tax=Paucibacter sp. Y2R2-4 TaxID=2893553 RepID=UPI0021E3B816|nr:peptidase M61 [Paucibacter sp. Y2R2-4]MCV2349756.1 peptidase M61 [Paucibacter sp. Y2R2-4]
MKSIQYRVDLDQPNSHTFEVSLTVPAPDALQRVSLPAWIPGSYLVREFARHLSGLRASQGGRELAVEQVDKATWQIACSGDQDLLLHYRVYAFDNSVRAAFLDAQRGFFNGTSLCLRVHGREQQAQQLRFGALPEGWRVATGMSCDPETQTYQSGGYEALVDHPFELGQFWLGRFEAGGVEHQFVVSGALPVFDGERLLQDAQRICEAQIEFWHGPANKRRTPVPFSRYVFMLNAVDEGYGGLEHSASTALIAPRRDLPRLGQTEVSEGYVRLLGLISHEYFHTWNVKRLKPADFAALDYTRENYTELLWFFEGFTSYYDELFLVRTGLIDEARYLKLLTSTINGVLATPGRKHQSLAQSSFDAWVKYYRPDENSPNSTISYYGKGALLALALDLSLRFLGEPQHSLDDVMRGLWQRSHAGLDSGARGAIIEADVLGLIAELGGEGLVQEFKQWVHGVEDLPLAGLLEKAGVQSRADKPTLAQRLGLRVNESNGAVIVKHVLADSVAQAAGFCAGDELLACNDWRLRRIEDAALTLGSEQGGLRFLLSRDQRLLALTLDLPVARVAGVGASSGSEPVLLSLAEKPPTRVASLRKAWLNG